MTRRSPILACLVLVLCAALPVGLRAQDDPDAIGKRLETVREDLEAGRRSAAELEAEAKRQAEELADLRSEMQAAVHAVRDHEAAIERLEGELARLADERERSAQALQERRRQLGGTLAALQRLSLRPAAALLVSPGDPNDIVRSGLLLRTAVPQIERKARGLRENLEEIASLSAQISLRREELVAAGEDLRQQSERLSGLVAAKNRTLGQTRAAEADARQRIDALAKESRSLGELMDRLKAERAAASIVPIPRPQAPRGAAGTFVTPRLAPAGTPSIAAARGRLTLPVRGTVVQEFGALNEFGSHARGVTLAIRPDALIVAPWDGRIAFSGPFRQFGQILIIEHGEGYHSLIAGLARVDAQVGQWVLAGEPVGLAGNGAHDDPGQASGRKDLGASGPADGRDGGPTLYVEFRHDGEPINPLPWMAARTDRIQG